jgi:3-phenylpropionate/trans-cinnamate dioxygenase ferredoxin subunit
MDQWIDVAAPVDIPCGGCARADVDGDDVLVVNVDGSFYAIDNICSHDYAELSDGAFTGREVECPLHGARFDVTTGEALCAPAYEDLRTYEVRLHEGMVQVKAPG